MHSAKEAKRSEINLVAVTRKTKVLMDVDKDAARAKEKVRKDPGASLRAPGAVTQPRLKPLFIS